MSYSCTAACLTWFYLLRLCLDLCSWLLCGPGGGAVLLYSPSLLCLQA